MTDNKHYVAVYGTLKRGQSNHYLIASSGGEYIRDAIVPGIMQCNGGFPMAKLFDKESDETILVEVFKINDECLADLDSLEGVKHNFYRRVDVSAYVWGVTETVWMYEICRDLTHYLAIADNSIDLDEDLSIGPIDWKSGHKYKQIKL